MQSCANALIEAGADLCVKNNKRKSAVNYLIRHFPNTIGAIEKRLDDGIKVKWEKEIEAGKEVEAGKEAYSKHVTMDFNVLLPTKNKKLSDVGM